MGFVVMGKSFSFSDENSEKGERQNCTAFLGVLQKSTFLRFCKKNGTKFEKWNKPLKFGTNGTNLEQLLEQYKIDDYQ